VSTGSALLAQAVRALAEAGVDDPARDARRLLAHAAGVEAGRLTLILPEKVDEAARAAFEDAVARRAARVPVAQITGRRAFYGRDVAVTADVLDPRPETETLVEACLAEPFGTVLDLGTGSGCILLTLLAEMPEATGVGVDASAAACEVARGNAVRFGVADRGRIAVSDWFAEVEGVFDLIVANPPYIAEAEMAALAPEVRDHEPHMALTDGGDGLGAYRAILGRAGAHLAPGGRIVLEIGPDQATEVRGIARAAGFGASRVVVDLDGRDRVVILRREAPPI